MLITNQRLDKLNAMQANYISRGMLPSEHLTPTLDNEDDDGVRGRSTSSDVSSDISPSPLYIPPHRRQPKTECTRGSDTGVR